MQPLDRMNVIPTGTGTAATHETLSGTRSLMDVNVHKIHMYVCVGLGRQDVNVHKVICTCAWG